MVVIPNQVLEISRGLRVGSGGGADHAALLTRSKFSHIENVQQPGFYQMNVL
jgi:hypothetical protein